MNNRMIMFFLAISLMIAPSILATRPTIAVMDFTVVNKAIILDPEISAIGWNEESTGLLTGDFINNLVATRRFDVLERSRVNDILREQEFSSSGLVSSSTAIKLGQMVGAEYFVMGQIELIDVRKVVKQIPYSDYTTTEYSGQMTVNIRIIDTRGGKIVAARKHTNHESSKSTFKDSTSPTAFFERLKENTVREMVNDVVDGVFPIKVASVNGNDVIINRGTGGSFKEGDILIVFRTGEDIKDPDTGESLGVEETEVGRIRITEMDMKRSKGIILTEPNSDITVGSICRLDDSPRHSERDSKPLSPGSSPERIKW